MKRKLLFFALVIIAFSSCNRKADIQECFETYKISLQNKDGKTAVKCLSTESIAYYEKILKHIKYSSRSVVHNLKLVDKYMVLTSRNRIPIDSLNYYDVRGFLKYTIDHGMIGKQSIKNLTFYEVKEIDGETATVRIKIEGTRKALLFKFRKQYGTWRIDIEPLITLGNNALVRKLYGLGMSEEEFISHMLKVTNNGQLSDFIWIPTKEQ